MIDVPQVCEIAMLCIFGASWPFNIAKSIRSRTARGKSVVFELLVVLGYGFGLAAKLWVYGSTGVLAYSTWFYIADIAMVLIDIVLYFRNSRLDRITDEAVTSGK